MNYEIELIQDEKAVVGEGPVWDPHTVKLYWTDIRTGRLFEYVPATGEHRTIHDGIFVGGLAVNKQGGLTLGTWEGVMLWRSDSDWTWLHHDDKYRFNDVIAGPDGSFYAGSMFDGDNNGVLYRFLPDGEIEEVATGLAISNGMGFSPDLKTFYHTDCGPRTIYRYDYDPTTHSMSNKSTFVQLGTDMGVPDGMTVDADGNVWGAVWGSGCVVKYDPNGSELGRINFPATQTSSAIFGGPQLNDLYVTTARSGEGEPPSGLEPEGYDFDAHRGGELYRVRVDVTGKPEFETDFAWPGE